MLPFSLTKVSTLDPTDNRRIAKDYALRRPLPSVSEIRKLLETNPRRVLSFANQFFSDDEVSLEFKIEVALRLIKLLEPSDRPHFWEALGKIAYGCDYVTGSTLFELAKESLSTIRVDSDEVGAIQNLLSDLRIFTESVPSPEPETLVSEYSLFLTVNATARKARRDELDAVISRLEALSTCESYLVRESIAEALGVLGTRSDLEDSDLIPYRHRIRSLYELLLTDTHPYVRQAAFTIELLIDF